MLRTLFFTVLMTTAIGAGLASPFGALAGYLWFALFRPQEWVWVDISAFRFSLVLGLLLLGRSVVAGKWPNLRHPLSWLMVAFLGTGLIAQNNAIRPDVGWQWLDFFWRLLAVSLLGATLVDSPRRLFWIVLVISTSLGFHTSKAGLASLIGGGVRFSDGLAGAFLDSNGYAIAGAMIIPLLIAVAATIPEDWPYRRFLRFGYGAAVPLTAFAIVSTFSRSGFIALVAVLLSGILLLRRRVLWGSLIGVTLLIVIPFVPLPEGYTQRLDTITSYQESGDESIISRFHFWQVAWDMVRAEPFGVGMYNFNATYDLYDFSGGQYGPGRSVHNSHLQVLAEQGFIGFGLWCSLFVLSFWVCWRIRRLARSRITNESDARFLRIMATALLVSMTAFLVGGTFIAMALNDLTWVTFGLAIGLDGIARRILHQQTEVATAPPRPPLDPWLLPGSVAALPRAARSGTYRL